MSRKKIAVVITLLLFAIAMAFAAGDKESTKPTPQETQVATEKVVDLSKTVPLKFNLSYGNKSRTMTYNQSSPLTLSDGSVVTAGMLKPLWSNLENKMNATFSDVAIQDAKANDMIKTESTSNFAGANIFGGNSIATELMAYGAEGKFVNLATLMEQGLMPNLKQYLDANPNVKASITAYDGGIYQVPYIAEIGEIARTFCIRESWVTRLLDTTNATYDNKPFTTYYEGYLVGANARTGANGGTVTPRQGVTITKKTAENIIELQNALPMKNGKTLTETLVSYIKRNYAYQNPSQLYLGADAAYDIDELVALFRAIKANATYLTDGKAAEVWPFFSRQSSYREDLLRMATYFDGYRVHGSDSYESRWYIDADGQIQYTYSTQEMYDLLSLLSDWNAEGLLYTDMFDLSTKTNHRSTLWGTDSATNPKYGFMTYDWIASSTADALNKDIQVILPPVAKVNGVWQYYMDNTRVIKPDGWAISVAGSTQEQIERASLVFDFFFTEDGRLWQNYGNPVDLKSTAGYVGPDGKNWPQYTNWAPEAASKYAKGDLSTFLRDWIGAQMPIGYPKEIGFEYQYTSKRGFDGWALLKASTTNIPSYAGTGLKGTNPNYYTLIPPAFSLTPRQSEIINDTTSFTPDIVEVMFNVIRYKTLDSAPSGAFVARDYATYLDYFKSKGLDSYVRVFQASYESMSQ
jgi:hypothetical protein